MFEGIRNVMKSKDAEPKPVVPEGWRPSNAAHFEEEAQALAELLGREGYTLPLRTEPEGTPDVTWSMAVVRAAEDFINKNSQQPQFYDPDKQEDTQPKKSDEEQERVARDARIVAAWKRARAAGESFIA